MIWLVFQNFQTFPAFPGIPGVPILLWVIWRWSGHTWCARSLLEESGCPWACLNSSSSFGLRHVLAGHPCRHRVGEAHSGSRINVEVVREQLGGQGILCIEVCCDMGQVVPPNHPLVGGTSCFSMGRVRSRWLSKFWCVPVLFWWVFGLLNGLDVIRNHLLDTQQLDSLVGELRSKCSQRSLVPVP